MDKNRNLYYIVNSLQDLKKAIVAIKQRMKKEDDSNKVLEKKEDKLSYLGRKKIVDNLLTYIIGNKTGKGSKYYIQIDLKKHAISKNGIKIEKVSSRDGTVEIIGDKIKDIKNAVNIILDDYLKSDRK